VNWPCHQNGWACSPVQPCHLEGLHRLPPECEAAREGCARVALARRLGNTGTSLRRVFPLAAFLTVPVPQACSWRCGCCPGRWVPRRWSCAPGPFSCGSDVANTRKQNRRPLPGNGSNGFLQPFLKKRKNTGRACEDSLPPLPLSLCARFARSWPQVGWRA
jgi:hypothetical protein